MVSAGVARQLLAKPCVLLLAGGLAAQHITLLLPYDVLCALLVASILAVAQRRLRSAALVVLGGALLQLAGGAIVDERLDSRYAGDSMLVRVRIADFPRQSRNTLTLSVTPLDDARVPPRVRISWFEPPVVPRLGEVWELELRLRRPRGSFNPGSLDVESWLFREKYHATGYVVSGKRNRLLWSGQTTPIEAFRGRFVARARAAAGNAGAAAVLAAIGTGDRHLLSTAQWQRFAETGTSHLMAISGLHVGLAALAAFTLAFGAAVLVPARGNHYLGAMFLGVVVAGAYALVSGLGVPARRATVMLAVGVLTVARRRQLDPVAGLAGAAGLVFVTDPVASLTPGFHLSFAAVAVLLWLARRRPPRLGPVVGPVRQLVAMQVFLLFGLLPLTAMIFGRFAVLAAPVNLVAVPVFSLVTVPATLVASAIGDAWELPAILLLRLAAVSVAAVESLILIATDLPLADGTLAEVEGVAWAFVVLPLAWVVLPRSWPARGVALLGVVALLTWKPAPPPAACFDAWVLDVGQGLAVAVRTRQDVVIYDTGMAWRNGATAAEHVILPFLSGRGIDRVSRLVVSHADLDHAGGVQALLRRMPVDRVVAGESLAGIDAAHCVRGQGWWSGAIRFDVLHPPPHARRSGNDASCVLRVSAGSHGLLLTGDIEAQAESQLLRSGTHLAATAVIVPHHGSRTSSSAAFVDAVAPEVAVVSAGHANRWGFPVAQVVGRWEAAGARMLTTAHDGAVFMRICATGGVVDLGTERQRRRRFWHDET